MILENYLGTFYRSRRLEKSCEYSSSGQISTENTIGGLASVTAGSIAPPFDILPPGGKVKILIRRLVLVTLLMSVVVFSSC